MLREKQGMLLPGCKFQANFFFSEMQAELCTMCPDPPSCSREELSDSLLLDLHSKLDHGELVNVYLRCLGVYEVLLLCS